APSRPRALQARERRSRCGSRHFRARHRTLDSMDRRLLLIEDEPGLVMTLTDRLAEEGFAVESCGDGETGLAQAASGAYDLIVLDVMLPRKSGLDVCRKLRQSGIETPILM